MMRELPILFNGEMVCATLDGRKTQTRRVVKPQPTSALKSGLDGHWLTFVPNDEPDDDYLWHCPYGQPGDRLWVRETHQYCAYGPLFIQPAMKYRADKLVVFRDDFPDAITVYNGSMDHPWRPSTQMPRWASRLTLEVVSVRIERVQDISEDDARAEGVKAYGGMSSAGRKHYMSFSILWDSINGKGDYSWDKNPWVWVVEFKRIDQ